MNDEEAVRFVDTGLKLSASEKAVLMNELCYTVDDPLLVIKVNSEWIDLHGQQLADDILDSIASFEMGEGRRRDEMAGGYRWIFHFRCMDDVERCSESVHETHPIAFSFSRKAKRQFAGLRIPNGLSTVPLGLSAVIMKMGPHKSDGQNFQFFAL